MFHRRYFVVVLSIVLTLSLAIIAYAQTTQAKPDAAGLLPEFNRWRTAIGIRPYQEDVELSQAAQFHSDDQVNRNYFDHVAPSPILCNGKMVTEFYERAECFGTFGGGEGITSGPETPDEAARSWLHSYGHCTGLMYPNATHMGGGQNGTIWTFIYNGFNEPDTPVDHEAFCRCTSSGDGSESSIQACVTQFNNGVTPVAPPPSSQQVTQYFPNKNSTYNNTNSGGQCCIDAWKPGTLTVKVVPVSGNPAGITLELANENFDKLPGITGIDSLTYTVDQPGKFAFWFDSSKVARGDTFYIETLWEAAGTDPAEMGSTGSGETGSVGFVDAQYSAVTVEELIQAIESANATPDTMETIVVLSDLQVTQAHNTDDLGASAFPVITSPITIVGATFTISRDASAPPFRFFNVNADGDNRGELILQDITLKGGTAPAGGAILNNGIVAPDKAGLTLTRVNFIENTSSGNGGAIFNDGFGANGQATMIIKDSIFEKNSAAIGGAIYNAAFDGGKAEVNVTGSQFTNNTATAAGNSIYNNGQGSGNATLILENVIINGLSPVLDNGEIFNDNGRQGTATVTINNSEEG
jgi:predicted outer membrane repeat protein